MDLRVHELPSDAAEVRRYCGIASVAIFLECVAGVIQPWHSPVILPLEVTYYLILV